MKTSPFSLAQLDEYNQLRADQDRAFEQLGGSAPNLDQQRAMGDAASQVEELYADLEQRLPEPQPTDRPIDYRVRLLEPLQRHSETWKHTDLAQIARNGGAMALTAIDRAIVADAQGIASDKTMGSFKKPGALREIKRIDAGGSQYVDFHGSPLSWMSAYMSPVRLAVERFMGQ